MSKHPQVTVINSGVGNLGSILNMLKKIGVTAVVATGDADIRSADRIVLPGVGSFDAGIRNLRATGLVPALERRIHNDGIPILGVCLGMQLLTRSSEEGSEEGLGWVNAETVRLRPPLSQRLPVPHMGWNSVRAKKPHTLTREVSDATRFYFVHSFHVTCDDSEDELLESSYGTTFTAAFARANIAGVQFHPEKSHKYGLALYRNFVGLAEKKQTPMSAL